MLEIMGIMPERAVVLPWRAKGVKKSSQVDHWRPVGLSVPVVIQKMFSVSFL